MPIGVGWIPNLISIWWMSFISWVVGVGNAGLVPVRGSVGPEYSRTPNRGGIAGSAYGLK